jgi:DNA primase
MTIPEIKTQLSIATVLAHYGLKADSNNKLCCPFHADDTPSLQVYPKTNTWHCFGCGKGADTIDFIGFKELCTTHEALVKATELVGVPTPQAEPKPIIKREGLTLELAQLNDVFPKMKSNLRQSKDAQEYAQARGLDTNVIEIGYNGRTYKDLKHCITFALRNAQGIISGMYGRSVFTDSKNIMPAGAPRHFYLKESTGLYPHYPNQNTLKLILTESIIDAATLLQLPTIIDSYSILACYGTNRLNNEIQQAIKALPNLQEIIFAFDNDDAGYKATEKYANELITHNSKLIISTLVLPNKDINETYLNHNEEVFTHLLENRKLLHGNNTNVLQQDTPQQEPSQVPPNQALQPTPYIIQQAPTHHTLKNAGTEQVNYDTPELQIALLGGISLQNLDRLRVTIYVRRNPHINAQQSIRQNIDLYQDDVVEKFVRKCAEKIEHSTTLISTAIAKLTESLEHWRLAQITANKTTKPVAHTLTGEATLHAIAQLKRPDLMQWTQDTLVKTGIVGEPINAFVMYIAMTSRLYDDPVSVICLSQSGTGKSYLLERVAKCFPSSDIIENTQFSDNSFYYWKEGIRGKIILIEDMEGAQNVEYPMREMITKKYLTKTVVHKDSKGNMQTIQHRVDGPATFLGCTTKEKMFEDNANRCILLYLDASTAQDQAIMLYQKQVRAGIIDKKQEKEQQTLLQNMQSLLHPKAVVNPFAPLIDLPHSVLKPRRSIGILLSFIEVITLYHQHQCELRNGCLVTHPSHIEWGFTLLKESLFRKSDELNASLRNFLEDLKALLLKESKVSFYAQETRLLLHKDPRTVRRYLHELQLYGYIKITGGNKYRKGHEYELTELGNQNTLHSSIDSHSKAVMEKIWQAYNASK